MDEIFSLVMSVVQIIISIIGVIITIYTLRKDFQNELAKQKANMQLDKMSMMPYEILDLLQKIIDSRNDTTPTLQKELMEKMNKIFSTIYAYGTSTSIHILATMQSENYQNASVPNSTDNYRMMAFYVLLTVQIRADITGEVVSPEEWFKLKIVDFQSNREKIKAANNKIVQELNLCSQYIIK